MASGRCGEASRGMELEEVLGREDEEEGGVGASETPCAWHGREEL